MTSLNRKLLREIWQLKGQMLSIALVVATGIMTVVTMRGSYDTLIGAQQDWYRESRFADIWGPLKRAPQSLQKKIEALPGVDAVDTRVTFMATLDLEGLDAPALGHFVSLPEHRRPAVNDIRLRTGRYVSGSHDEVIISEKFASARKLRPGDSVRAIINGRARDLDIVGIAISPEHAYAVPPGSLYPDDERYGVFWMARDVIGPAYAMDGAFNEVVLTLAPGANSREVIARLNQLLDPYGGFGAYPRKDQISHAILQGELDQNRIMGTAIPAIFLAVAAFLLNLVLSRLIATQRTEIAVLKAFGYRTVEVGFHYLMFALTAVVIGTLLGSILGVRLGEAYIGIYGAYFDFPDLHYQLQPMLLLIAIAVSLVAACAGALLAVYRAVALPPAEAMRPEPPARFHAGWLERLGISSLLPAWVRMIVRNLERKPLQSFLSSLGVALSVAILLVGLFMFDGVEYMMNQQFREIQREDMMLTFNEPLDAAIYHDLRHLQGVTRVETFRALPARLRAGHLHRDVSIQGLSPDGSLRRIVADTGGIHPVPTQGAVLSATLAKKLKVTTGDTLQVEVLEGRRARGELQVTGVVNDFMGESAYMSKDSLAKLAQGPKLVSGALLSVSADARPAINRHLKNLPAVAGVSSPATALNNFKTQMADSLFIAIGFLVAFAGVIAVGVIYNGARISLSERGRELASLRVIGFRRGEAALLLLGEQAVLTIFAVPLGWFLGYWMARGLASSMQTDAYRIPFIISSQTYALSALLTIAAAIASGLIVRHRVDHLDLIAVLKNRE
jgi:putative ABC transport system permease protein